MQLGIIGSGKIVRDFLTALPLPGLKLAAIATTKRSAATCQELADQYGISRVYDDYLEMLKDDQVDTVYVATPFLHALPNVPGLFGSRQERDL